MIQHVLLDIEGTTAPISFVHDVLFPYARNRLEKFLLSYSFSESEWSEMQKEYEKDKLSKSSVWLERFVNQELTSANTLEYLFFLMDVDRKFGVLKKIQGLIWKAGYESGEIQSQIFPDVPIFLEKNLKSGIQNHVYSSGSREAQILIYKYSNFGDLTNAFVSFFDTVVGGKREANSYTNICESLDTLPNQVHFYTDILEEAEAAKVAGLLVTMVNRPGNFPQGAHSFPVVESFL